MTVTVISLSPVTKPWSPEISTLASGSVVSTATSTSVVPAGTANASSLVTASPLIVTADIDVSSESGTSRVTTYS